MESSKAPNPIVSDLRKHVGFWLRFVSSHVSQAFAVKLLASGVTVAEWVVMREMFDDEELVSKNLITRRERGDDRRFQSIALTAAGRRLVPRLAALADQNDEEFFHPLSAGERAALIATMKKLVQAHGLQALPTE
jgi:hypothetical protein